MALIQSELEFWFSWLPSQDGQSQAGWKLHDIRLPELDSDLNWSASVDAATRHFHGVNENSVKLVFKELRLMC